MFRDAVRLPAPSPSDMRKNELKDYNLNPFEKIFPKRFSPGVGVGSARICRHNL